MSAPHTEKDEKRTRLKKIIWAISIVLILLIGFLCFFSARWYVRTYGRIGFDSVMFTLTGNLNGVNIEHLISYLVGGALPVVVCTAVLCLVIWLLHVKRRLFPKLVTALTLTLSLSLTVHAAFHAELVDYLVYSSQSTQLFEENYVDPETANIQFPEEKRNLIYIILESMETSYLSTHQGGGMEENLIESLYAIARENVNFSNNGDVGGFKEIPGASWTMGALVAHTSGIPLKPTLSDEKEPNESEFLPGVYTLFELLKAQGYDQALMVGSNSEFGGRRPYYLSHGVDHVYDLYTAWEDGPIENGYNNNFWGFEDLYLYQYAREKLTEMSQADQPFAFTMLTVDTHSPSGYECSLCGNAYEEGYANVVSCADRQLQQFLQWLQEQPFYENTTIVITGDHGSMNNEFFLENAPEDYERHLYNCFINAAAEPVQTQNRQFCAMDMFPTTLAAMGCTIEGDRLGLGTNLFSHKQTLMEQMGYEAFCIELTKNSDYYENNFYE